MYHWSSTHTEEAMKSLKQYLAESEKSYKFRLRSLDEISDEHMDKIESHMKKYNMEKNTREDD